MENLTTDALYPEYKIWEQFVPGTLLEALELDALNSSHPIEVKQVVSQSVISMAMLHPTSSRWRWGTPARWTRSLTTSRTTRVPPSSGCSTTG